MCSFCVVCFDCQFEDHLCALKQSCDTDDILITPHTNLHANQVKSWRETSFLPLMVQTSSSRHNFCTIFVLFKALFCHTVVPTTILAACTKLRENRNTHPRRVRIHACRALHKYTSWSLCSVILTTCCIVQDIKLVRGMLLGRPGSRVHLALKRSSASDGSKEADHYEVTIVRGVKSRRTSSASNDGTDKRKSGAQFI